jgi:Flp pilus assembly pilin Flp
MRVRRGARKGTTVAGNNNKTKFLRRRGRFLRRSRLRAAAPGARNSRAGGVNMEYVILATLIAAAVVVAVVVFSRSIATMFFAAGDGATLRHTKAQQDLNMRRGDRDQDAQVADDYHDRFHE